MAQDARGVVSHKLVLLGDTSVGKSCLVVRFVRGEFFEYQEPTIGAAFLTQTVSAGDTIVRFELWDTAGQERYRSLAPMYYRGAAAAVVVFDVTSRDSFEGAKSWVKELQRRGDPSVVIALAGNKCDMGGRTVSAEEASAYASEHGLLSFDTSARTGTGVRDMFVAIAKKLPKAEKGRPEDVVPDLNEPPKGKEAKAGCC